MSDGGLPAGVGKTALGAAAVRAAESRRADRLFDDPCAEAFLAAAPGAFDLEQRTGVPVPLVQVTHDDSIAEPTLRRLAKLLPAVVAEAVACPEEPWTGPPSMGDIENRFRRKGPLDVGELNCVVEVRTKLFASREADKRERAEMIGTRLSEAEPGLGHLGVWLILCKGAWWQRD